jgi:hypothetical protein
MNINGAAVTMGSTVYITAIENQDMTVATIEGYAEVEAFGVTQRVEPGAQVELPLQAEQVSGPPSDPQPFEAEVIELAPVTLLERPVQIPSPLPPQPTRTQQVVNTQSATNTPGLTNTPRPTGTATDIPPTAAPIGPNLRADATTISASQCTTIRWERLEGISQIYFDGQPTNSTAREVCPSATRTYTLLVIGADNTQTAYNITITVE